MRGESAVREDTPEYTNPVATKGTQELGHEGESAVREETPEYTNPVATKGTQEPGREENRQFEETPEYTNPVVTKGTQEPGREGESAVREDTPEYTNPVSTKERKSQCIGESASTGITRVQSCRGEKRNARVGSRRRISSSRRYSQSTLTRVSTKEEHKN